MARATPEPLPVTTNTILPTSNEAWGFWGTIDRSEHTIDTAAAWTIASETIASATGCSAEGVRDFLDSRHGRHFADDVANELHRGLAFAHAVEAAVQRWMGWRIDRSTSRETGIPAGLPYLTGFVAHHEILFDAAGDA